MARKPYVDKNGLKKGPWSKDEDDKLRAYIERYGHWNWREIPRFAGVSRCGKSCRLRWMNYLRPNIKHGNFTKEEEGVIMEMHNKIGNKWAKIAAELPGRSDNEIKNYWHTHLKKRAKLRDHNDPKNNDHETENQTDVINSLVESSDSRGHDEAELPSSSSLSLSASVELASPVMGPDSLISCGDSTQTYGNEYDDRNFWTDPIFADLDGVYNMIMDLGDDEEFMWSTMDLYFEYHSQFML